jgi:YVTN family beta-propeller protein
MDGGPALYPLWHELLRRAPYAALAVFLFLLSAFQLSTVARAARAGANAGPLRLDAKIPLGPMRGRIDHMAIDVAGRRLFVAELGNNSVGVVDLKQRKTVHTIGGLAEPQGVGYAPATDAIYVANARDGSVRIFRGADYVATGRIDLGSDADNVRLDADANRVLIGHGGGAISAIDVAQQKKAGSSPLPAHPESFQIWPPPKRVFVNVPGAHAVIVLDGTTGKQKDKWAVPESGNFPMAIDPANRRVLIVSRNPPKLIAYDKDDGSVIARTDTCGDSDDLFVDPKRSRVYISCGAGAIDVFAWEGSAYRRLARVPTVAGARTSLFVPDLDVLLLAVRATLTEAAAIWVFKPQP